MMIVKEVWKQLSFVNIFFILYTIINNIWIEILYKYDNWLNIYTTIGIALLLIPIYTFLNSKVDFGQWYIVFFIPFIPYMIYQLIIQPIWYSIFTNPFPKVEDFGVGFLSIMIGIPHWFSIMISIILSFVIKGYKDNDSSRD